MKKEINATIEHANRKLIRITEAGFPVSFDDVKIRIDDSEGGLAVYSGDEFVAYVGDATVDIKIWAIVDKTRAQVETLNGVMDIEEPAEIEESNTDIARGVMDDVEKMLGTANAKLAEVTAGGFPFAFDEVKMTADHDNAGIYIHSGKTPVLAVARTGDPRIVLDEIRAGIFEVVDATRVAMERRGNLRKEAQALKDADDTARRAAEAVTAAGLDAKTVIKDDINREAAKAIANAARQILSEVNRNPFAGFIKHREFRLTMHEYSQGFVILADGKECLITRFPKIGNNKTVENMVKYIKADITALAASRRAYFERVRRDADREERLRALAQQLDAAEAALHAVAVM